MKSSLHRLIVLLGTAFAASCGGAGTNYAGAQVWDHFPLDGNRSWEYKDDSRHLTMLVEKGTSNMVDGVEHVTLEYSDKDAGDLLMEIDWVSDVSAGVLVDGYRTFATFDTGKKKGKFVQEDVTFDNPIQFMDTYMQTGDTTESSTNGFDFVSTFVEVTGCATIWSNDWADEDCFHFNLDDGDDDPTTNAPIVGDYWTLPRWGTALFQVDAYDTMWNLSIADWAKE
jgi:hypothetical protein